MLIQTQHQQHGYDTDMTCGCAMLHLCVPCALQAGVVGVIGLVAAGIYLFLVPRATK